MALYYSAFLHNYGYSQGTGKTHRHLLDKITLVVQANTPFMDMISRAKVPTNQFEWIEETLNVGNSGDKVEYGETYANLPDAHKSIPALAQRNGYVEQFGKGIEVYDEQESTPKASLHSSSEMSEQEYNKMIEMKTDIEASLLQNPNVNGGTVRNATNNTGEITTPATLTGAFHQIAAANVLQNTARNGSTSAATTVAQLGQFWNVDSGTPANSRDCVRLIDRLAVILQREGALNWKGGNGYVAEGSMLLLTPNNKYDMDRILDSRPNVRRDIGGTGTMLGMMFDTYTTSYGSFKVFVDNYLPGGEHDGTTVPANASDQSRLLMFNPANWALAVNKDFYTKQIGTPGFSEIMMIGARFGLIHKHQRASAAVESIDPRISSYQP